MALHPIPNPAEAIKELIHWVGERDSSRATLLDQVVHELVEQRIPDLRGPRPGAGYVTREQLGMQVRGVWLVWAAEQPVEVRGAHSDWLTPWEGLSPEQREVDMRIGEVLFDLGVAIEHNSPPAARVWRIGDPQPPRNTFYLDRAGDIEQHEPMASHEWALYVEAWGPLVEVSGVPDYEATCREDRGRRAVIEGDVQCAADQVLPGEPQPGEVSHG